MAEFKMGECKIGPASWRNNTLAEIKVTHDVIKNSEKSNCKSRTLDALPNLRDILLELSNDEAIRYFRQTRIIVGVIRESIIETNEEVKSLTRIKEALEKCHEHTRKDLALNNECNEIRKSRPAREKDYDGADDLLHAEKLKLLSFKLRLEQKLQLVKEHLQVLDKNRQRQCAAAQERTRVLELISHGLPAGAAASSCRSTRRPRMVLGRAPATAPNTREKCAIMPEVFNIDPLGPYTPEIDSALIEAKDARVRSQMLRYESKDLICSVDKCQKVTHANVNVGLDSKVQETKQLKQQLGLAYGQNKGALNRAHRLFDHTERSWQGTKGPQGLEYLETREKLTRPMMSVFHRHPGNNMPEAQNIIHAGDGLLQSLQNTRRNIGTLNLAKLTLSADMTDKKKGIDIDSAVVKLRRRKANHRWVMNTAAF